MVPSPLDLTEGGFCLTGEATSFPSLLLPACGSMGAAGGWGRPGAAPDLPAGVGESDLYRDA